MTDQGTTVRRAALVVFSLTATTLGIPIAEFVVWPRLVDPTRIEQTRSRPYSAIEHAGRSTKGPNASRSFDGRRRVLH
jgi:hypothetical protein